MKISNPLTIFVTKLVLSTTLVLVTCASALAQNGSLLHATSPQQVSPQYSGHPFPETMMNSRTAMSGAMGGAMLQPPSPTFVPANQSAILPIERPPVSIQGVSWTYQPAPLIRTFRKHDIVTIRVDEIARVMAEGAAETRKRTLYKAVLSDWIKLTNLTLGPAAQADGDPTVGTLSNNNYRAESTVESRESMTFNIAAKVVDIRPNGLLVLEATKAIRINDNLWETSMTGICRAQDITPDNVVLSKDMVDLEILKADRGHLRDGYKRGWFQRWFDRVQPF